MSKNRGYREHNTPIDEAMPAEIKNEFVEGLTEDQAVESTNEETATVERKVATGVVTDCIKLNIRKEPNTESESLRVISAGDEVEILDKKTSSEWLSVQLSDGTKGYTMTKYIKVIN